MDLSRTIEREVSMILDGYVNSILVSTDLDELEAVQRVHHQACQWHRHQMDKQKLLARKEELTVELQKIDEQLAK